MDWTVHKITVTRVSAEKVKTSPESKSIYCFLFKTPFLAACKSLPTFCNENFHVRYMPWLHFIKYSINKVQPFLLQEWMENIST